MRGLLCIGTAAAGLLNGTFVHAWSVPIYGGMTADLTAHTGNPACSPGTTFYSGGSLSVPTLSTGVNSAGQAFALAYRYVGSNWSPTASYRWDSTGCDTLLSLDLTRPATGEREARGINESGLIVGGSIAWDGVTASGEAVRWGDVNPVALADPLAASWGQPGPGVWVANGANAVNDVGQVAGSAGRTDMVHSVILCTYPYRWDGDGTPHELGHLGEPASGSQYGRALAINNAGTAIGYVNKYVGGVSKGARAVRWDASGAVQELGNLGTDSNGDAEGMATKINSSGQAAGVEMKYIGGISQGTRAIRWSASGDAQELADLGYSSSSVGAINDSGTVVGCVGKFMNLSGDTGHAVQWGEDGSAQLLGTLSGYSQISMAYDINDAGWIVGTSGGRAVLWESPGTAIDLNTLIDPGSGWTLQYAESITNNAWISGVGMYDPDGAGGAAAYPRAFLMQVPEPASVLCLGAAGVMTLGLRRRQRRIP